MVLAEIPLHDTSWQDNKDRRCVVERRFIAAALQMGIPLTNKAVRSEGTRQRYLTMFDDLTPELRTLEKALAILS